MGKEEEDRELRPSVLDEQFLTLNEVARAIQVFGWSLSLLTYY